MKTIVVASGKGGTGKTTLTALLAYFASRDSRITVCDTDVEASNLPLALRTTEISAVDFIGRSRAKIDEDVCIQCGACELVCRFSAISSSPYKVDGYACEGCTYCMHVCPSEAISLSESRAGKVFLGKGALGSIAYGQLEPAEDLSGKLVTEVRRVAREQAELEGSDLILVDGPPGIGCPVIAAIANADILVAVTEPTVSGEHDLARLNQLASRFGIPVVVVLNKADLSQEGTARIRRFATEHDLPLIGEIPFDPIIGEVLAGFASSGIESGFENESASLRVIENTWTALVSRL